jgi:hypothetical protein
MSFGQGRLFGVHDSTGGLSGLCVAQLCLTFGGC